MNPALEFLKRVHGGGRIVSAADLNINEVARANEQGRIFSDGEVFAVFLPWDTSTPRDRTREREFFGPRESDDSWSE